MLCSMNMTMQVYPSRGRTVGSQFEIYVRESTGFYGEVGPIVGELADGADVLRSLAAAPVTNAYLAESKGRSMPGSPSFARPRDIPVQRQLLHSVRIGPRPAPFPQLDSITVEPQQSCRQGSHQGLESVNLG